MERATLALYVKRHGTWHRTELCSLAISLRREEDHINIQIDRLKLIGPAFPTDKFYSQGNAETSKFNYIDFVTL
jgi:hypothetical protein